MRRIRRKYSQKTVPTSFGKKTIKFLPIVFSSISLAHSLKEDKNRFS